MCLHRGNVGPHESAQPAHHLPSYQQGSSSAGRIEKSDSGVVSPELQSCNRKMQGSDNFTKGVYENPTVECKH
jgi:hypothetical protein